MGITNPGITHVFKFGGASVRDAESVENVLRILKMHAHQKLIVVISAMGKVTNLLEEIHSLRFTGKNYHTPFSDLRTFHEDITFELLGDADERLEGKLDELRDLLSNPVRGSYDEEYDQIVCYGELLSTLIVHAFLQKKSVSAGWLDARLIVRTDDRFRDARVNWEHAASSRHVLDQQLQNKDVVITQGFIGSTATGKSTTLGREGSDFTAAILAFLCESTDVTIWKDVPGMLNADPRWRKDTVQLDRISFKEAIELAYYGASVIHPKTIKPLQNKGIPLYIKSFLNPESDGSVIQELEDQDGLIPCYIYKANQVLVSFATRDFSFIVEDNLQRIFSALHQLGIRVHMMENSALQFSIVFDGEEYKINALLKSLQDEYSIKYNTKLILMTIRHGDDSLVQAATEGYRVMLMQRSRNTARYLLQGE
ncbi:MAG: aspartate kinase [Flavobacteriales bacterium]